jgi:uncharacterized phage protein (TIGR01671 family)
MKREIKFRALFDQEGRKYWKYIGVNESIDLIIHTVANQISDWVQFTGIKDVNGNDIYEGDILALQYPIRDNFGDDDAFLLINVVIEFHGGSFWFNGEGYTDCNWHFYDDYKIVGNIYENPELL